MSERKTVQDNELAGYLAFREHRDEPRKIVQKIVTQKETEQGQSFTDENKIALWQFGSLLLNRNMLARTKGSFIASYFPCGFMLTDEDDVMRLEWKIGIGEYASTIGQLSKMAFRIYDGELTTPDLKKTAHDIVDFTKTYYAE
jgi:hypothetical protein